MKKQIAAVLILSTTAMAQNVQVSFVQPKKVSCEKPSQIKEKIIETLENLLTRTSDLIASIAQEQHLIVVKVHEVAQSEGSFAQTTPQKLTRYHLELEKMAQELEKQHEQIQKQFKALKKDFSERS